MQGNPHKKLMDKHKVFMLIHEFFKRRDGGASRDRTDDPLLAKQVLSQLSYGPTACNSEIPFGQQLEPFFLDQGRAD